MIDRKALLTDLSNHLKTIEADLLSRSDHDEVPEVRVALRAEFDRARAASRTAMNYEDWRTDFITQIAVAWVLTCVFVRFIEDNDLIASPRLTGPGERDQFARDQHQVFVTANPTESDREYLLSVFAELRDLRGGVVGDVFGQHNILWQLHNWISGDAATELLKFFRTVDPDSGKIVHDFTDPDWDTRFLGDLYQDLSAAARKKYALLQTPDFVEEFILDRTLEPALNEFGLTPSEAMPQGSGSDQANSQSLKANRFKMIDPACGSGHFLLGSFTRILRRWREQEPGGSVRDLAQRTLNSIHGVDINPFAIAIARFRLLLAALKACGLKQLEDAPAFKINLACGDSLYHGRQQQLMLEGVETDESHYFQSEDEGELKRILKEGTFHAVVANPPYIVPNDRAANAIYRTLYPSSCYDKYALSAPFMERLFSLGLKSDTPDGLSAYVGQITANSFFKAEFGKRLVSTFFLKIELTGILDTSIVDIPGHTTPTVILFGRCRPQINQFVRVVEGIDGGKKSENRMEAWDALCSQFDQKESESDFASSKDSPIVRFHKHPWSLGGNVETALATKLNARPSKLKQLTKVVGRTTHTGEDSFFYLSLNSGKRLGFKDLTITVVTGEDIRDYVVAPNQVAIFPYDKKTAKPTGEIDYELKKIAFAARTVLRNRVDWDQTPEQRGLRWFDHSMLFPKRYRHRKSIACAEITTHVHFVVNNEEWLFDRTAPVIQLPNNCEWSEAELAGLLNSSVSCFWGHHRLREKAGATDNLWEKRYVWNATNVKAFPLPERPPQHGVRVAEVAEKLQSIRLSRLKQDSFANCRETLNQLKTEDRTLRSKLMRIQEDLDWECYSLYGLVDTDFAYVSDSFDIDRGQRAFEIVMARKIAAGELTTTWFCEHGSTPITEIPEHWPDDYKELVQRRIDVIESNANIALIEQPEYKRRWNTEPWDSQVARALRSWLLDRLESYFDFDGRMNDEGKPTAKFDIEVVSIMKLADVAAKDEAFMEVGGVYRDDTAFDVVALVEELLKSEHVPLLPILRYKATGLRKRIEWENTWRLQREEDVMTVAVDAAKQAWSDQLAILKQQRESLKTATDANKPASEVKELKQQLQEIETVSDRAKAEFDRLAQQRDEFAAAIPVPPKYAAVDFLTTGGVAYWKLRGKLDVPKERWISLPHCPGDDGTLALCWAGYDHLQQARAISAHYVNIRDNIGGSEDLRLVPLLAGLTELLPWLH